MDRGKRQTKDEEEFEQTLEKFHWNLNTLERRIERFVDEIDFGEKDLVLLKDQHSQLDFYMCKLEEQSKEFVEFLKSHKTFTSDLELSSHYENKESVTRHFKLILHKLSERIEKLKGPLISWNENKSGKSENTVPADTTTVPKTKSCSGTSSRSSSSSATYMKAKAKAEATKAGLRFAEKEAEMKKFKALKQAQHEYEHAQLTADIEHKMDAIAREKAVAEAEAEVTAMEEVCQDISDRGNPIDVPIVTGKDLVRDYIESQHFQKETVSPQLEMNQTLNNQYVNNVEPTSTLNANAKVFEPQTSEITKYLIKKELSISRLLTFNDQPQNYVVWKSSFKNIVKDLEISQNEEVDLLTKYLGPDSKKYALSMRFANINEPDFGLKKIWTRLEERYGSPEQIERSLKDRLENFPKLNGKDTHKLYDLYDLLSEIECVKSDDRYKVVLSYFDSSTGINPIINKLPYFMQNKWTDHAVKYKSEHSVVYPTFKVFVEFVHKLSVKYNDPSFSYDNKNTKPVETSNTRNKTFVDKYTNKRETLTSKKTDVISNSSEKLTCPIHENSAHSLKECKVFASKSRDERKDIILKNGICFRCLSGKHLAKDCKEPQSTHGGEVASKCNSKEEVNNKCTQICGDFKGKSCSKTLLVNITKGDNPHNVLQTYVMIDDQSNGSLARSKLFDHFNDNSSEENYVLSTCAGDLTMSGRRGNGYKIESLDGEYKFDLPRLIECNQIPNVRQEIPTPEVAKQYRHLQDIYDQIPTYNENAEILLLIGRDLLPVHHVLEQKIGDDSEPYAQKLKLGWVIIGESCLGLVHKSDSINVNKTNVLNNGRPTIMNLCPNNFNLKPNCRPDNYVDIGTDVFERRHNDDSLGMSRVEKEFLEIMEKGFVKTESGNWSAPLPFTKDRPRLPNNYHQAKRRFELLNDSLQKNPEKQKDFMEFMGKILKNGHAEKAPELKPEEERWYLPIFGVYHNQKKKLRVVFDSAAKHEGLSLNDILLKGPDLTNNLAAVLLRFRKEKIGISGDLEQFFFNFLVHEDDRNYLRFLWYEENNIEKPMIEYRMRVHVFGNKPSPAVANYGLLKTVCNHESEEHCDEVCKFVKYHFYVDDGLTSQSNEESAVKLIMDTQKRLSDQGNIRLHKLSSNSLSVLQQFPTEDVVKDIVQDMELGEEATQRSLGLLWKLNSDIFTYKVSKDDKPYTKRGVLSVVNSIFDPLGFVAPVVLGGKLLLRKLVTNRNLDWDDALPPEMLNEWLSWKTSLKELEQVEIPRCFSEISVENSVRRELHVFSDASKEAVGAVAYLKLYNVNNAHQISFVVGKSKVAPDRGHTIPRLELCGAVLATELASFVSDNLNVTFDTVNFYTDSQVVLGYIFNRTRKFYVYVSNRIDKILHRTTKEQWKYVPTEENPADMATRKINSTELSYSKWISGPTSFLNSQENLANKYELVDAPNDKEIRPETFQSLKTSALETLNSKRFEKFSQWTNLITAIATLKQVAVKNRGDTKMQNMPKVDFLKNSENFVINLVQTEFYVKEKDCLRNNKLLKKDSALFNLSPYLDNTGILRVGGRLKHLKVDFYEKNPIIIPSKNHIATLIVRHFHERAQHQGRHLTEGLIRSSGYWIIGGKRLISSIIHHCVRCRILRGKAPQQIMSNLPVDRITPCPPFTYIGVDVFGPWNVVARRTRGGQAHSKRWAVIFCCMVTRAIHLEVIEDMSTSSFINSLRRFIAIRGSVKQIRSDRGTNFVGAVTELNITSINIEDPALADYLNKEGITWLFNTPYSSHMGGSWERLIGITRRILDNMLFNIDMKNFTHEVLTTFMAEVCAIVNGRPLVPVSDDPANPFVLTPNILLTQKYQSHVESLDYFQNFTFKDMYKSQWRFVQVLAENFWKRWSSEYLQTLQVRQKWQTPSDSIKVGNIVLVKDPEAHRNDWPLGIVERVFPSEDGKVRKVEIRFSGKLYIRPITQVIVLLSE